MVDRKAMVSCLIYAIVREVDVENLERIAGEIKERLRSAIFEPGKP